MFDDKIRRSYNIESKKKSWCIKRRALILYLMILFFFRGDAFIWGLFLVLVFAISVGDYRKKVLEEHGSQF